MVEKNAAYWKAKNVTPILKYKAGAKHKTDVINEIDGSLGGHQVEHYDGSQDAVVIPQTIGARSKVQKGSDDQ